MLLFQIQKPGNDALRIKIPFLLGKLWEPCPALVLYGSTGFRGLTESEKSLKYSVIMFTFLPHLSSLLFFPLIVIFNVNRAKGVQGRVGLNILHSMVPENSVEMIWVCSSLVINQ